MIEAVVTVVGKVAGSLAGPAWNFLKNKFWRPSITQGKAPKNLLEHLKPMASQARVRDVLGSPHQVYKQHWFYSFSDVLVQIEFWDDDGVKFVSLGLVGVKKENWFQIPGWSKPLGKITIADVIESDNLPEYRYSLKHEEILVKILLPAAGSNLHVTFGAMSTIRGGNLYETEFKWDRETNALISDPAGILVNWVAVSNSQDEVYFDYSAG